jgi:hypothetical protein
MRGLTYFPVVALSVLFLATTVSASAQTSATMKATAPERMLPSEQTKKMRACEKLATQQKIIMEDRSSFVANCMANQARPK